MTAATRYSLYENRNAKIATAAIAGPASGSTTSPKAWNRLAPSILAASSRSIGMPSKKARKRVASQGGHGDAQRHSATGHDQAVEQVAKEGRALSDVLEIHQAGRLRDDARRREDLSGAAERVQHQGNNRQIDHHDKEAHEPKQAPAGQCLVCMHNVAPRRVAL